MRFGCCTDLDKLKIVQDIGYDYIELPITLVKPEASNGEFDAVREALCDVDIVPEVWYRMLPADVMVVGPEVDLYRIERYLRTAFERVEELGGEVVIYGSGSGRRIPEGFPPDEAYEQLVEFITLAGQIAGTYGLTVAVEPLNPTETNTITSLREAVEFVRAIDHPFVKVVADLHHMQMINEPMQMLIEAGNELAHTHVADGERMHPGRGGYPVREFMETLRSMGYNDRMSVECHFKDFAVECEKALQFPRGLDEEIPF